MANKKSEICRTANYLVSTGMSRRDAFKAAWQLAKQGGVAPVAGVTKQKRQTLIERLTAYKAEDITITLRRDQENIFDQNAIAVVASVTGKGSAVMGYIPALAAVKLARLMDRGTAVKAKLERIVGGYEGFNYGLRVRLAI